METSIETIAQPEIQPTTTDLETKDQELDLEGVQDLEPEQTEARLEELIQSAAYAQIMVERWQLEQKVIKEEAWVLLATIGGKHQGELGSFMAVQPGTTSSYDSAKLEALTSSLEKAGLKRVATALKACKKNSNREGYVRFSLNRE